MYIKSFGIEINEAGNSDASGWGYPSFQSVMTLDPAVLGIKV